MATATSTELSDAQWQLILPLLPPKAHTGRPRAEDRKTLRGYRLGLDREYGEDIWRKLLSSMDEQGKLDWSKAFLDGEFIPAKKGERR